MSSEEPDNLPAQRQRRASVREKAQQVNTQLRRRRWIRRGVIAAIVLVLVAAAITAVVIAFNADQSRPQRELPASAEDGFPITGVDGVPVTEPVLPEPTSSASDSAPPAETTEPAAGPSPTAAPMVDIRIFVDYLSAESADFQASNSEQLVKWWRQGAATITYHPVATLTAKSNGTKYSQRAAAAAACVGTISPESFYAFNSNLLAQQPEVDTDGLPDTELATLAVASGVAEPKRVQECIEKQPYFAWARAATERAQESLPGADKLALIDVPTVLVNGELYVGSLTDPAEFSQFVLTVSSDTYYDVTPEPSPSSSSAPEPSPSAEPSPSS